VTRKKAHRCPECGSKLDESWHPKGRTYQCHNMECLSAFDDDDDLGDDPVSTTAARLGEPVELVRDFVHCGKALEGNDRSCALPQGHRGGPCLPTSDL
jgi:ssDNA-binding Zn-finger/Zn-ribbon topoisomerase 1